MMTEERLKRLVAMIKKYDGGTDVAAFRNAYRALIDGALQTGEIGESDVPHFLHAREHLEAWAGKRPPELKAAFGQWLALFEKASDALPPPLFEALLGRVPAKPPTALEIGPLIAKPSGARFLRTLLSRRLLKLADFLQLAKADPTAFYRSAALDIVVENKKQLPRSVWSTLAAGTPRSPDLIDPAQALVASFKADKKRDAPKWLVKYLAESPATSVKALRALASEPAAAVRLVVHLAMSSIPQRKGKKPADNDAQAVAATWIRVVAEQLEEGGPDSRTAALVLDVMRLASIIDPLGLAARAISECGLSVDAVFEKAVVDCLRFAESGDQTLTESTVILIQARELYHAVQEYLRTMPGVAGAPASPARSARHERYLGRRDVVQELLPILEGDADPKAAKDAIEVSLFNVGVRALGDNGEVTKFDPHRHQAEGTAAAPGDVVRIIRPGWILGETDGVILKRAVVHHEGPTSRVEDRPK